MSDQSARLNLPFLMPSQAQKHITHNEALELLDALVQAGLSSLEGDTPPASPADGEMHALGTAPTGDWANHAGELAYWNGTGWLFLSPQTGWQAWDITAGQMCIWDGSAWVRLAQAPDQVDQLGIQTDADTTNRLAVQSPATLLTHDGAGHQLKINKASATDTASLLFQSGWTGHAEIGLAGDNGLTFKTSADGAAWATPFGISNDLITMHATFENFEDVKIHRPLYVGETTDGLSFVARFGFSGDRFTLTPTNKAGGYDWEKQFYFDPAGEAVWSAEGGFHSDGSLKVSLSDNTEPGIITRADSASFSQSVIQAQVTRSASVDFDFLTCQSSGEGDTEFRLVGDGNAHADGAWFGGGADYAEYFEWLDGNPKGEDRRGISVVLEGAKIRHAQSGETPIGVISATPSIVGDSDMARWKGKYLRDEFGGYLWETYDVFTWENGGKTLSRTQDDLQTEDIPVTAERHQHRRRCLNPAFDPDLTYVPRAERPEWAAVGLLGKLRLRTGCPVGPNWVKLGTASQGIEDWLVR